MGTLVYVAAGAGGLKIVDVSTPTAPRIVGSADTPGTAASLAVSNGYAYVADSTAVEVINVTTPSRPVIVGSLATAATAVAVAGSRVYTLNGSQLNIIDVTIPTVPRLLSATDGHNAQHIALSGTLALLAAPALTHFDLAGGLYVVDVSNPATPLLVKQVSVPGSIGDVTTMSNVVYTADSASLLDVVTLN